MPSRSPLSAPNTTAGLNTPLCFRMSPVFRGCFLGGWFARSQPARPPQEVWL